MRGKPKKLGIEVGKFSFVGLMATIIDIVLFNVGILFLGLPILIANVVSTTLSSLVSFRLNKRLTFNGQRHSHKRTIFRYVLIVGASIYLVQNIVLYIVGNHFGYAMTSLIMLLEELGWTSVNEQVFSTNLAKLCAVYIASVWNFLLLRRFVFIHSGAEDEKRDIHDDEIRES